MSLIRNVLIILAVTICLSGKSNSARVKTADGKTVCACTLDYRPVCDTTGAAYSNFCSFECARDEAVEFGRAGSLITYLDIYVH